MGVKVADSNECICIKLVLRKSISATYNLEKTVCNHGLFMMAPNCWIPSTKTLQRPLRLFDESTSLTVSIFQPPHTPHSLLIRLHTTQHVSFADQEAILGQVSRMLRISEKDENDVQEFHKVHPQAKRTGFGRLFRSPSLFEDVVKSMLLCNCTWKRTLEMADALCKLQLELTKVLISHDPKNIKSTQRKRKRSTAQNKAELTLGNFPTAKEVASLSEEVLKNRCKLGYRARHILEFAQSIKKKKFELQKFDQFPKFESSVDQAKLYRRLMNVGGLGPFSCATVMMCIGFYDRVPQDSETTKHLPQYRARKRRGNRKNVRSIIDQVYGKYAPFQCLAYWFERVEYYESKLGRLSNLSSSSYSMVTGSIIDSQATKVKN